jgi:hypothetical protein
VSVDVASLCKDAVTMEEDFAQAFHVAVQFTLPNFGMNDIAPLVIYDRSGKVYRAFLYRILRSESLEYCHSEAFGYCGACCFWGERSTGSIRSGSGRE